MPRFRIIIDPTIRHPRVCWGWHINTWIARYRHPTQWLGDTTCRYLRASSILILFDVCIEFIINPSPEISHPNFQELFLHSIEQNLVPFIFFIQIPILQFLFFKFNICIIEQLLFLLQFFSQIKDLLLQFLQIIWILSLHHIILRLHVLLLSILIEHLLEIGAPISSIADIILALFIRIHRKRLLVDREVLQASFILLVICVFILLVWSLIFVLNVVLSPTNMSFEVSLFGWIFEIHLEGRHVFLVNQIDVELLWFGLGLVGVLVWPSHSMHHGTLLRSIELVSWG